jgi:hypothetical protein
MNAGLAEKYPIITDADFGIGAVINHANRCTILGDGDVSDYRCFTQRDQLQNKPRKPHDNIKS